jgi:hypothetical protein
VSIDGGFCVYGMMNAIKRMKTIVVIVIRDDRKQNFDQNEFNKLD